MSNISYSAVVLDAKSTGELINRFSYLIPYGWKLYAHHQTINMGEIKPQWEKYLGMNVNLTVEQIGISDKAIAVKVSGFHTTNEIPHVTLAVNVQDGGKPVMSNDITDWEAVQKFNISGTVKEIER